MVPKKKKTTKKAVGARKRTPAKRKPKAEESGDGPIINIEPLFTKPQILEAIDDLALKRKRVRDDVKTTKEMIDGLGARRAHYRHLIKSGKFNKVAMTQSISDMDVEIRRYQDKNAALLKQKEELTGHISMLHGKLKELETIFGEE